MEAKAAYLNGVSISLRKITANIRVNTDFKCQSGTTLEASSTDSALKYKINPQVRRIPAMKAAIKCQKGIEGIPTNMNRRISKNIPNIPKEAIRAMEDLRNFVLNTLSSMLAHAHTNVAINARNTHIITL